MILLWAGFKNFRTHIQEIRVSNHKNPKKGPSVKVSRALARGKTK